VEISVKQWNMLRKRSIYEEISVKKYPKRIYGSGRNQRASTAECQCLGLIGTEKNRHKLWNVLSLENAYLVPRPYEILVIKL
jgi:hypothetical protein